MVCIQKLILSLKYMKQNFEWNGELLNGRTKFNQYKVHTKGDIMKKYISVVLVVVMLLSVSNWGTEISYEDFNKKNLRTENLNKPEKEVNETTMFVPKSSLLGVVSAKMDNTDTNKTSLNVLANTDKDVKNNTIKTTQYVNSVKSNKSDNEVTKETKVEPTVKPTVKPTAKPSPKPTQKPTSKPKVKTTKSYSDEDLTILTRVIYGEASGQSWDFQVAVGSVVLNRVKSNKFPNTIKEVVFQRGQYACTWDGNYNKTPNEQAKKVARYLLENGSQLPSYVLFQAEFLQGRGVYKKMGNTYFCY